MPIQKDNPNRTYRVALEIRRKEGVTNPEGATIEKTLPHMRLEGVSNVRANRLLDFTLEAQNRRELREKIRKMMTLPLQIVNPTIDDWEILRIMTLKRKDQ